MDEFRQLLAAASEGSVDARRRLVEVYAPHVLRAVRRRLSSQIRSKFDSVDFVQAVWASFFESLGNLSDFDRPENLIAYLVRIAQNKVIDEVRRRMFTEKYNVRRERSLDDRRSPVRDQVASSGPSPSQEALAGEMWSRLLDRCPESHREILKLRAAGNTHEQIAEQVGVNERTVRRVISNLFEACLR